MVLKFRCEDFSLTVEHDDDVLLVIISAERDRVEDRMQLIKSAVSTSHRFGFKMQCSIKKKIG